jgi:hypothetical protein
MSDIPVEKALLKPSGYFSKILAAELDKLDEYYKVVTLSTSDRGYLERAFQITERLIHDNL